jgi:hypothetical protein
MTGSSERMSFNLTSDIHVLNMIDERKKDITHEIKTAITSRGQVYREQVIRFTAASFRT